MGHATVDEQTTLLSSLSTLVPFGVLGNQVSRVSRGKPLPFQVDYAGKSVAFNSRRQFQRASQGHDWQPEMGVGWQVGWRASCGFMYFVNSTVNQETTGTPIPAPTGCG